MKDTYTDGEDHSGEFRTTKNASFMFRIDIEVDSPAVKDAYTNFNAPRHRAEVNYTAVRKQLALFEDLRNFNLTPSTRTK